MAPATTRSAAAPRIATLGSTMPFTRGASATAPIIVIVSGICSPRLAISDTAASTGTVGWHTLMMWQLPYSPCR